MKKLLTKVSLLFAFASIAVLSFTSQVFAVNSTIQQDFGVGDPAIHGGVTVAGGTMNDKQDTIIDVVKRFINYTLGFLGLIALIMLMRGGFKMVTAGGDEGAYKEGFKILKNAAIGIAFIGVSWLLTTFIFYIFSIITT